jgi:hypothetical protein
MHVIITERRYDAACLEKHALGLDKLEKHVADKTPEWAWAITGIAAERIRESARFIAGARPASLIHPGRRATWYGDDTQRARAMAILAALLGSWGRRGGYIEQTAMPLPAHPAPPYPEPARAPADHPRGKSYPLAQELLANGLRDASIPGTADYDIKAWLVYGTNLIQTLPDADRTRKAIEELDLIVSIDVLPAEITGFSDVVLPECTYLERADDLWAARHREPFVALRQPAVEPSHDSKPGWWIAAWARLIAGYCPGTSVVAAASGNLDGLATLLGVIGGSLLFGFVRPLLGGFPESTARGHLFLYTLVGAHAHARPALGRMGDLRRAALACALFSGSVDRRCGGTRGPGAVLGRPLHDFVLDAGRRGRPGHPARARAQRRVAAPAADDRGPAPDPGGWAGAALHSGRGRPGLTEATLTVGTVTVIAVSAT